MDRPTFSARLRYAFDSYMSRGTGALVGGLFLISVVLILVIAGIVEVFGGLNAQATQGVSFIDLLWTTLMRTIDTGNVAGDSGTVVFVGGMFAATVAGIFLVAVLIGIV